MFGPVRGPWPDDSWKGWWGEEPPYHMPVYVLTHHARAPLEMKGGTTFYFVTDGTEWALKKAKGGANGKDVRIGGGVATIRQYLARVRSTKCTCLPPRFSWAKASICSRESICTSWDSRWIER
jgi:dihydrofolate reductase